MSKSRVWAYVEGSNHDIPFYESLLVKGAGLDVKTVQVLKASDLEVEHSSAGGKERVLQIMNAVRDSNGLRMSNNHTNVDVLFFVDRDDDNYLDKRVECPHVIYTEHTDVEAEIIAHSSLEVAVAEIYSLASVEAGSLTPRDPMQDLAERWAEWIAFRLAFSEVGWGGRFSQTSTINRPTYGALDKSSMDEICAQIADKGIDWEAALERAQKFVESSIRTGNGALLVKGKWMPEFVRHRVREATDRELPKPTNAHLITACRMTIDYEAVWSSYEPSVKPLLVR